MPASRLEHINLTVADPLVTARMLEQLFDWHVRWHGKSIHGGFSVHVGSDDSYVALYTLETPVRDELRTYDRLLGLNHLGIVVDDLDGIEERVLEAGFQPRSHANYDPGRRFYFDDLDGLEIEVVSYDDKAELSVS